MSEYWMHDTPGFPGFAHVAGTEPERCFACRDGTSGGEQCGAVHDIAGRCTRDMAHPGAHVARSSTPGRGSGAWLNVRPGEPDRSYVDRRHSDEYIRGVIGGAVAKLGLGGLPGGSPHDA